MSWRSTKCILALSLIGVFKVCCYSEIKSAHGMKLLFSLLGLTICASALATGSGSFALAINKFGLNLQREIARGDRNLCLSPFSIEIALAMVKAGAGGATRIEMENVLQLPRNDMDLFVSFDALTRSLAAAVTKSEEITHDSQKLGGPSEPITFQVVNRLFVQQGYTIRTSFLELIRDRYGGSLETFDFSEGVAPAADFINRWVSDQTRGRIRDLVPTAALNAGIRLLIADAVFLKAPWWQAFPIEATKLEPFLVFGRETYDVPMMVRRDVVGYVKHDGFTIVTIPYIGGDLQFVIVIPDVGSSLPVLEAQLSATLLAECVKLSPRDVIFHLPRFKVEPSPTSLTKELQKLGMRHAFDIPKGSANFGGIAPDTPSHYLFISDVFHETFISVNEQGTEAAAATAVSTAFGGALTTPSQPIEVKVDRPFFFAVQHVPSGACLFMGRITDPR